MSTRFKRPIIAASILSLLTLTGCECCRDYFAWNHTPRYDWNYDNFGLTPIMAREHPNWMTRPPSMNQFNNFMKR